MSAVGQTVVAGHGLQREGRPFRRDFLWNRWIFLGPSGEGVGLCRCGQASPVLPTNAARRRWHNEHKAQARLEPPT